MIQGRLVQWVPWGSALVKFSEKCNFYSSMFQSSSMSTRFCFKMSINNDFAAHIIYIGLFSSLQTGNPTLGLVSFCPIYSTRMFSIISGGSSLFCRPVQDQCFCADDAALVWLRGEAEGGCAPLDVENFWNFHLQSTHFPASSCMFWDILQCLSVLSK